jgi:ABC-type branched-subunit amino acid transport system ATPase component
MSLAVETRQITGRFGPRVAVDRVDLAVPRGAIYGFFGPNGAGRPRRSVCCSGCFVQPADTFCWMVIRCLTSCYKVLDA